ncbi:uncharacterized protein LOC109535019 isoform X2 [Dendroctonus ponderosae]
MEEKVRDSVMERVGFFALVGLAIVGCCTTMVLAERRQELNGDCFHVKQCYQIGYLCARNRTCQCGFGYVVNEKRTKCIGVVGSRCIYDSHCIEGAYCTGREGWEVCKCREEDNFIPSEDLMSCVDASSNVPHLPTIFLLLLPSLLTLSYLNT